MKFFHTGVLPLYAIVTSGYTPNFTLLCAKTGHFIDSYIVIYCCVFQKENSHKAYCKANTAQKSIHNFSVMNVGGVA